MRTITLVSTSWKCIKPVSAAQIVLFCMTGILCDFSPTLDRTDSNANISFHLLSMTRAKLKDE